MGTVVGVRRLSVLVLVASLVAGLLTAVEAGLRLPSTRAAAATPLDTAADAAALAASLQTESGTVVGGNFVARPPTGTPNALATVALAGFPRDGGSYALLTTGDANLATQPNNSSGAGASDGGPAVHGTSAFDVTILKLDLAVPANVNCLIGFDFRFFSEEYPEYVGSSFNDGFVAELDKTTWTADGSALSAPDNFAFDPAGKVISVNSTGVADMSPAEAAGTTYDAATGLLSAATPITPGAHSLYLSIFDQGDHVLDSAVAVDSLRFGRVKDPAKECVPGAKPAVAGIPLGQTFGKTGGFSPGGLPGYVPPGYAKNPTGNASDPVNTATGAYTATVTDALLYTGSGPTDLTRSYTSADTVVGVLGRGWTHTLAASLTVQASGDILARAGNGQQVLFTKATDGSYAGPPGTLATLTAAAAGGWDLRTVDGRRERFDGAGRLQRRTDRTGRSVELAYDPGGRLERATVSPGRSFLFDHNADGRLVSVTLPDGRHVDYGYDGELLTSVRDLAGGTTRYTYDAEGRLTSVVNQNGDVVVRSEYDGDGRVSSQTNAVGAKTSFAWDASTQTSVMTDPNGGKWTDDYTDGLLTARSDPLGNRFSYTYDDQLNVTQVTDPRGDTTALAYDANGNLTRQQTPDGAETRVAYTGDDAPAQVTTADGVQRTYAYDDARLISATSPDGAVFRYQRDASGLLRAVVNPQGAQVSYAYDDHGDLVASVMPQGERTAFAHDAAGRLVKVVDPRGTAGRARRHTHRFVFDDLDRIVRFLDPLGHATSASYDAAGNLTAVTDANGHRTRYDHDAAGRITAVHAADTSRTTYRYDAVGNVVARTDGNGHETTYHYDAANRLVRLVAPGARTWSYRYDANGNLAAVTDANGNATDDPDDGTTRYTWDSLERVTRVDYSDGTPDVALAYDSMGRLTTLDDGAGTARFSYDDMSRLTAVTRGSSTFRYSYDSLGRLTSRTYPSGATVSYGYDANGQLRSVRSDGGTTRYTYDPAGNRTSVRTPNGVTEVDSYDAANRLTGMLSFRGRNLLDHIRLRLDAVGNPLQVSSRQGRRRYGYDALDRLRLACFTDDCRKRQLITYDAVGNRTSVRTRGRTVTTSYDEADQPSGPGAPTFDRNGNQTSVGGRTARYDLANRLVELVPPSPTAASARTAHAGHGEGGTHVTIAYDGLGNRVRERVVRPGHDPGGAEASGSRRGTRASDITLDLAQDLNAPLTLLAEERSGDRLLRRYLYGDAALGVTTPDGTGYYTRDYLGSVTGLRSASGRRLRSYRYDVDGNQLVAAHGSRGKGLSSKLAFTGQYRDDAAGLYDLRARAYDPTSGRFLQRDPYPRSQLLPAMSPYAYADARPTALVDPSGQCPICVLAGVGAVVGGAAGALSYWATTPSSKRTTGGWVGAVAGGAFAGAVGGVAGPVGGTVATSLGASATGLVATGVTAGVNFLGGVAGEYIEHSFSGEPASSYDYVFAGMGNAIGGWYGARKLAGTGMSTLKQVQYFAPRTWSGVLPWSGPNSLAVWGSALVGGAVNVAWDVLWVAEAAK